MILLTPLDSAQIPTLLSFMEAFYALDSYPFDKARAEKMIESLMAHPDWGKIYLINHQKEIAGYIILTLGFSFEHGGRDAFIDELYLKPEYRGQGIGKIVLERAEKKARELGIQALHLEVEKHNSRAHKLYLDQGFKSQDRILMNKPIKP
ncbi:GNAT family N-acetyltransferase [bacterium SCSIO 12741]|nr:GNAT family N-acetyltransferase [bacterium SCSIO 12741]